MENLVFVTLLLGGMDINGNKVAVYEVKRIIVVGKRKLLKTVAHEDYYYGNGFTEIANLVGAENIIDCGEREVTKKEVKEVQRTYPRFSLQKALGKE